MFYEVVYEVVYEVAEKNSVRNYGGFSMLLR
jgi:hypothetical protein